MAGIVRTAADKSDWLYKKVQSPRSPFAELARLPDQFLPPGEKTPAPSQRSLRIHPGQLRFAWTADGAHPRSQQLRLGVRGEPSPSFEVVSAPDWLEVLAAETGGGESVLEVRLAGDWPGKSGPDGARTGRLVLRPAGDHAAIEVAVHLVISQQAGLLESLDDEGRPERRILPDGGVIDYVRDDRGLPVLIRYPDGSEVAFEYDSEGRRLRMEDARGVTLYRYDRDGRLAAFDPPDAGPVRYAFDSEGRLSELMTPDGSRVFYSYDPEGRLEAIRHDGGELRYRYDGDGRLLERRSVDGPSSDFSYDADGRLVEVSHLDATGETIFLMRRWLDAEGRAVEIQRTRPQGTWTTHRTYDRSGHLLSATRSDGATLELEYDDAGRRSWLRRTDNDGGVQEIDFHYDDAGRLAQAGEEIFAYDRLDRVVARTSDSRTVRYGYDFEGRLSSVDTGEHRVDYELDGDGRRVARHYEGRSVSSVIDPTGILGGALFDVVDGEIARAYLLGLGRLGTRIPGQAAWQPWLEEQPSGQIVARIGRQGEIDSLSYDALGKLRSSVDLADFPFLAGEGRYDPVTGLIEIAGRNYDPTLGLWLNPAAPRGGSGSQEAPGSAFSALRDAAFGLGRGAETASDGADGEPKHVTNQLLQALPAAPARASVGLQVATARRSAPELDAWRDGGAYRRPQLEKANPPATLLAQPEVVNFAASASGLVPAGQVLEISSSTGEAISFSLEESIPWLSLDAASGTAGQAPEVVNLVVDVAGLDAAGSPYTGEIAVSVDGGSAPSRTVSVRLTVSDGETSAELRSYDANDRLQRLVKPDGGVIDYFYDGAGRLIRIRYPGAEETLFTYDENGNRTRLEDTRGTTVYQYDSRNRLVGIYPPGIQGVQYTYDDADNLIRVDYPGGEIVTYGYDADNRLLQVTTADGVTTYRYDDSTGALVEQTLANGVVTTYGYDAEGRLVDVEHRDGAVQLLVAYRFTLDVEGRRTQVVKETASTSSTTSLTYDDLGRLATTTFPSGRLETYAYDEAGQRTALEIWEGGQLTSLDYEYDPAGNLLRAGDVLFQYDLNGNLIRRIAPEGVAHYSYDARNRLVAYEDGATQLEYSYDGDGRLVGEVRNGVETQRVNGANGQPLIEATGTGELLRTFRYGIDQLDVAELDGGVDYLLDQGPFSTASVITNGDGQVVSNCDFDPFGNSLDPACDDDHLFEGFEIDEATGLVIVDGDLFDPATGRFINRAEPPDANGDRGSSLQYRNQPGTGGGQTPPQNPTPPTAPTTGSGPMIGPQAPAANQQGQGGSASPGASSIFKSFFRSLLVPFAGFSVEGLLATFAAGVVAGLAPIASAVAGIASTISGGIFDLGAAVGGLVTDVFGAVGRGILSWIPGVDFGTPFRTDIGNAFSTFGNLVGDIFRGIVDGIVGIFGKLGGVSLNKTADLMLDVTAIEGATFDPATGQLVLFGQEDISLPPLELEDMSIAVDSIFLGQDPGVSIDPPIQNGQMSVRYEGVTQDTAFGDILFEADRVLKILTLGKDNITGGAVGSSVPGYRNLLQRRLAAGGCSSPDSTRMWFQPKEVKLVRSEDGQTMIFEEVSMELLHESTVGNQVVSDPQAAAFAAHFTANYDLFAQEWPVLQELERLGKIVAVMKWIDDNDIPIDLSFIDNYPIEYFSTPVSTPVVSVQGTSGFCTTTLTGGVTFRPPNEYISDDPVDPVTDEVRDAVLGGRPSENDFLWDVDSSQLSSALALKANGPLMAVAHSFARSRKDGDVSFSETDFSEPVAGPLEMRLVRTYDSFADISGPLGPGWSLEQAGLRFPTFPRRFTFSPDNLELELHESIWVRGASTDGEQLFELVGIDGDDLPLYLRSGSGDLLRRQANGEYLLLAKGARQWRFSAQGLLLGVADGQQNEIAYARGAGGRIDRIEAPGGRALDLVYDALGRLERVDGPGGRSFSYAYDGSGRLAQVTDPAGAVRTYAYDADDRLSSAVNANGDSILAAAYDDYDRSSSRTLSSAAIDFDFELATRRTEAIGPLGSRVERFFDERFRPVALTDALGNRLQIAYDGDLGPESIVDAQGRITQRAYDVRGNLVTFIDGEGQRTELYYDYLDRLVAVREAAGTERGYGYDEADNLTEIYRSVVLIFDGDGELTGFNFDPDDVTRFDYDTQGELVARHDALAQATLFERDGSGRLTRTTSATGKSTDFVYDDRSRLVERRQGGVVTRFEYDDADNLTAIVEGAATTRFEYDAAGRLVRQVSPAGGATELTLDASGNPTEILDPASGVTRFTYDALGRRTESELADGTRQRFDVDPLGRTAAALTELGDSVPRIAVTADQVDFGRIAVGQIGRRTLSVLNLSRGPLELASIAVSSPGASPFQVTPAGPLTLDGGAAVDIELTFTPTALGAAAGTLSIESDDPSVPILQVGLTAEAVAKVQGLTATGLADAIRLDWQTFDIAAAPFLNFNVYRSTEAIPGSVAGLTPIDQSLADPGAVQFIDESAVPGTNYYYAVTAAIAGLDENKDVDAAGPVAYFTSFDVTGPERVFGDGTGESRPAVAHNAGGEVLLVFEKDRGGQRDIFGQRLAADGTALAPPFAVVSAINDERRPSIAFNPDAGEYLVVYEIDFAGDGSNSVVQGQRLDLTGTPIGGSFFVGGFIFDETLPDVVYNAAAQHYLAAFEMDGNNDGKLDVVGRRIAADGSQIGNAFFIGNLLNSGVPIIDRGPRVAYQTSTGLSLVVYEGDSSQDESDYDVFGTLINGNGERVGSLLTVGDTITNSVANIDSTAAVSYDGVNDQFFVVWEANQDGSDFQVLSRTLRADGSSDGLLSGGFVVLAEGAAAERRPRAAFNASADEHLVVWEESGAGPSRIVAQRFQLTPNQLLIGGILEVSAGAELRRFPDLVGDPAGNQTLVVWQAAGAGGPEVHGRLLGNAAAALTVDPAALIFSAGTTSLDLQLSNDGEGNLEWLIEADRPWLSASPGGGSTADTTTVEVQVDRTDLAAGQYDGALTVTSNGGGAVIPVTLEVSNHAPDPPINPSPSSGSTGWTAADGGLDGTLGWQAEDPDGDDLRFDLFLADGMAPVDALDPSALQAADLSSPAAAVSGLTWNRTYYWRVVSKDQETSTAGPVWQLTTAPIPAPLLEAQQPDPTNASRPTLRWSQVTGASGYEIQVASQPDFTTPLISAIVAATAFTPTLDLPEGSIHWRVRSRDAASLVGPYSPADEFLVDLTAPGVPGLIPIHPERTGDPRPLFSWNEVPSASAYRLQIAPPGFAAPLVDLVLATTDYTSTVDLPEGELQWRVASRDEVGNQSAFSVPGTLVVDLTPPPQVAGLDVTRSGSGAELTWQTLTGFEDFAHYAVYRSPQPFANVSGMVPLAVLGDSALGSFTDVTAQAGTSYAYAVTGVDTVGNELRTVESVWLPANQAPAAPSNPSPDPLGGAVAGPDVNLGWQAEDPEGADVTFDLYLDLDETKVDGLDVNARVAQSQAESTFLASGQPTGVPIYWRVVSFDDLGASTAGPVWSFVIAVAPVTNGDAYSVVEDELLEVPAPGLLGNDSHASPLTAVLETGASHGTVSLESDGAFTYQPASDFFGSDRFTYRATDGFAQSAVTEVSIEVLPVNDAPRVSDNQWTTAEDTALVVAAPGVLGNDLDPEGQPLSASVDQPPAHGTLVLAADGGLSYTPGADFHGVDVFTYTADDGELTSPTATVTVTVSPINDLPVAGGDAYTVAEDTELSIAAPGVLGNDSDADGDVLSAVLVDGPDHAFFFVFNADGSFSYQGAPDYAGTDSFTYSADDGAGSSEVTTVQLDVTPVNDAPVANDDARTPVDEDQTVTVAAPGVLGNDSDADGDPLSAILVEDVSHGTLSLQPDGSWTYTPAADFNGVDSFRYRATDGSLESAVATVSVNVSAINDAPVAVADAVQLDEDSELAWPAPGVLANDTDVEGQALLATLVESPSHAASFALAEDGSVSYTPAPDFHGTDSFTYFADDGLATSMATTVTIEVLPVNDPPVAAEDQYPLDEDGSLDVAAPGVLANDSDVDGEALSAVLVSGPVHGIASLGPDGSITYTPEEHFNGSDALTYRARDAVAESAPAEVTFLVQAINDAPVAVADGYSTATGETLTVSAPGLLANDADVESDALAVTVVDMPSHAAAFSWQGDGSFVYTPVEGFSGVDGFTYFASDAADDSSTVRVTISIGAIFWDGFESGDLSAWSE